MLICEHLNVPGGMPHNLLFAVLYQSLTPAVRSVRAKQRNGYNIAHEQAPGHQGHKNKHQQALH
jgi:hypothetical protein